MNKSHLSPEELAERWGVSYSTLASWRGRGYGPRFLKMGLLVRYPLNEIERWERLEMRVTSRVSEPDKESQE